MQPTELIEKHYSEQPQAKKILLAHSLQVARLAVTVATRIKSTETVDITFIEQAALLHDIGMCHTATPQLCCFGQHPYISHGILGATLLRKEGFPRHALVCERHIGVGLSVEDIREQNLPLPLRDMRPQTLEEEIVAYADLFFSKSKPGKRTAEDVRASLGRHAGYKVAIFDEWHERFRESELG